MARRTITDQITILEAERDAIEASLEKTRALKAIESQGTQGARTEFTDPARLWDRLTIIENKLETLYRKKGL